MASMISASRNMVQNRSGKCSHKFFNIFQSQPLSKIKFSVYMEAFLLKSNHLIK